jgi:uncharacterized protein involved in exopolysaccharide biosynthesis
MHFDQSGNWQTVDISMRDLVAPLFRRKRLLVVAFVCAFAVLMILGFQKTRMFKAQMSILVQRERIDPVISTESPTAQAPLVNSAVTLDEINSEAELLKSDDLLRNVAIKAGLGGGSSNADNESNRAAMAERNLARALQVHNEANSDLIHVSYESSDPREAYTVLKTLGDLYIEKHVSVHRPPGSYDFFAQEAERYRKALVELETRLRQFGHSKNVAAPDVVRTDLALQLASSTGQLHSAEQAMAADRQRIASDETQMANTPARSATQQATAPADKLLNDLRSALLQAEARRSQLAVKYQPTYPLVIEADREVAAAKAAIDQAEKTHYVTQATDRDPTFELLREDLAKSKVDLAAQRATIASTKQSIQSLSHQMVTLDDEAVAQQDLLREQKSAEDSYTSYVTKREQARTIDALDRTRIANVAIAVPASIPVLRAYSLKLLGLISFVAAAVFSLVIVYIRDYFASCFYTPSQVVDSLGIPVVVSIRKLA